MQATERPTARSDADYDYVGWRRRMGRRSSSWEISGDLEEQLVGRGPATGSGSKPLAYSSSELGSGTADVSFAVVSTIVEFVRTTPGTRRRPSFSTRSRSLLPWHLTLST